MIMAKVWRRRQVKALGLEIGERFMLGLRSVPVHFDQDGVLRMEDGTAVSDELQRVVFQAGDIITLLSERVRI